MRSWYIAFKGWHITKNSEMFDSGYQTNDGSVPDIQSFVKYIIAKGTYSNIQVTYCVETVVVV